MGGINVHSKKACVILTLSLSLYFSTSFSVFLILGGWLEFYNFIILTRWLNVTFKLKLV